MIINRSAWMGTKNIMTKFEALPQSLEKYDRNTTTNKVPNATQASFRRAEMLICKHCKKNWNEHLGYFVGKAVPGMCLTEENFKETGTKIELSNVSCLR